MTDERKICRTCAQQVRIIDEQELLFLCPTHGTLQWWQVTHGDPAPVRVVSGESD